MLPGWHRIWLLFSMFNHQRFLRAPELQCTHGTYDLTSVLDSTIILDPGRIGGSNRSWLHACKHLFAYRWVLIITWHSSLWRSFFLGWDFEYDNLAARPSLPARFYIINLAKRLTMRQQWAPNIGFVPSTHDTNIDIGLWEKRSYLGGQYAPSYRGASRDVIREPCYRSLSMLLLPYCCAWSVTQHPWTV